MKKRIYTIVLIALAFLGAHMVDNGYQRAGKVLVGVVLGINLYDMWKESRKADE